MRIDPAARVQRIWPELKPALIALSGEGCVRSGEPHVAPKIPGRGTREHRAFEAKVRDLMTSLRASKLSPGKPRYEPVENGTKVTIPIRGGTVVMNPAMSPEPRFYSDDLRKLDGTKMSLAFVVSRIGGEDGVSLEAMHWMRILSAAGHPIHVITGQRSSSHELAKLEKAGITVHVIPEADPDPSKQANRDEFEALFTRGEITRELTTKIDRIRGSIEQLIDRHQIDGLMLENFTLPWHHLAMGAAVGAIAEARRLPA